jgi:hypothetical protein
MSNSTFSAAEKPAIDLAALPFASKVGAYFAVHPRPGLIEPTPQQARIIAGQRSPENLATFVNPYFARYVGQVCVWNETTASDEPPMTAVMPLAINAEKPETIARALTLVEKAAREIGGMDLFIWANCHTENPDSDLERMTDSNYDRLTSQLSQRHNGVRYLTGLQMNRSIGPLPMSTIRFTQMGVLLDRARNIGYAANHPVIWLDADITQLSKNVFAQGRTALEDRPFSHPKLQFSTEWAATHLDDATRAFIINELIERKLGEDQDNNTPYIEECGLTFTLETYLQAGGVRTDHPMREAPGLVDGYGAQERLFSGTPYSGDPLRVTNSVITRSGRGALRLMRSFAYSGIDLFRQNRNYQLWCHGDLSHSAEDSAITPDIVFSVNRERLCMLTEKQKATIIHVAGRLWPESSEQVRHYWGTGNIR